VVEAFPTIAKVVVDTGKEVLGEWYGDYGSLCFAFDEIIPGFNKTSKYKSLDILIKVLVRYLFFPIE
jgi:hypothetical protein